MRRKGPRHGNASSLVLYFYFTYSSLFSGSSCPDEFIDAEGLPSARSVGAMMPRTASSSEAGNISRDGITPSPVNIIPMFTRSPRKKLLVAVERIIDHPRVLYLRCTPPLRPLLLLWQGFPPSVFLFILFIG